MEIKRRTPRTDLQLNAILVKMGELLKPLAQEIGASEHRIDEALTSYARISVRVSFGKDELDFDLIQPGDSTEVIKGRFDAYLDTQCVETVEVALRALSEMDRPADQATAPIPPEGAAGES